MLIIVQYLILAMSWVGLPSVIVAFLGHTHSLFVGLVQLLLGCFFFNRFVNKIVSEYGQEMPQS